MHHTSHAYVHALGLAPLLGLIGSHTAFVLLVDLVAKNNEREIFRVTRTSLDQKFVSPTVELFERLRLQM
jgi:hypothetical protein